MMLIRPALGLLLLPWLAARAGVVNLSTNGIASASSSYTGVPASAPGQASDGNRNGHYFNGLSVWHSGLPDPNPPTLFELDLGGSNVLDRVMIWPRTDARQDTVTNFRLSVLDAAGGTVWQQDFLPTGAADHVWGTAALRGVRGQRVRLERLGNTPNFVTFAEFEVWGSPHPLAENLALGKPVTSSPPGFSTLATTGNDGDLASDYSLPGRPLFHTATQAVGQFWQVDLGARRDLEEIRVYCRADGVTTGPVKLSLFDETNALVHTTTLDISPAVQVRGGNQYDLTHRLPSVIAARHVRLETLSAQFLAFGEVEVFGPVADVIAPTVLATLPASGATVPELAQVEVEFSEEVLGLDAADLRVNGVPAIGLTALSARRHAFHFAQPTAGLVSFAWDGSHGIQDAASNAWVATPWSVTLNPALPLPRPLITEFLADNQGGHKDEDGDSPDWIEIHNPGPEAIDLAGWFLSDDPARPTLWRFPSTPLPAGGHMVVFASDKNRAVSGRELHTNFKLDANGDSLLLVRPDGVTVASSHLLFPAQRANVSFGPGRRWQAVPLVATGATARMHVPAAAVPGWESPGYDDSAWTPAVTGVGFDVGDGAASSGLLGYWPFDDATTPGLAPDASGNARTGIVVNAVYTADAGGHTGLPGDRALDFPGNGVVHIPAAASGAFDQLTTRNAATLGLWVYGAPTMPVANYAFYAAPNANGTGARALAAHLPWTDSVIYWDTAGCCDPGLHRLAVGEPNPARWRGQWNHYVFLKNDDRKEIWQNGLLLHEGVNAADLVAFRSLFIGAASAAGLDGYRGLLDDVALWEGGLDAGQIAALAAGTPPPQVRRLHDRIATDLASILHLQRSTAYLRVPFTPPAPESTDLLRMRLSYDDGFVAHLNGVEVARRAAPASPSWDSAATTARAPGEALVSEEFDLSAFAHLLTPGTNVLAVQGLNLSAADPTFLLLPELLGGAIVSNRFFAAPTPGAPNDAGYEGFVGDTAFLPRRGFYDAPITVTITCATPGAWIAFTTDGSETSPTHGTRVPAPASVVITNTTPLRASAYVPNSDLAASNLDTHTYLFLDQVAAQTRPAGVSATYPGGAPADFAMDPRVPGPSPSPGYSLREALLALPTLSITTPVEDLWGPGGIYVNSAGRGRAYERAAALEWMDPAATNTGFSARCGLRIHGNISRDKNFTPKHGFKLLFRGEYGQTRLNYPLFAGSPVDSFDDLILRAGSTDTWPCTEWAGFPLGPNSESLLRWMRRWASYVRDQWTRTAFLAIGQPAAYGRYCHLYLNGLYWGLYNLCEHPNEDFMASHLGGEPEEWDTLVDFNELNSGTADAWNQLLAAAAAGFTTEAAYQAVQGNRPDGTRDPALPVLLNVDSLIDYMLLHITFGADDWPNHNWWAGRRSRSPLNDGFHFFPWDQEISNVSLGYFRTSPGVIYAEVNAANSPAAIYAALRANAEFRLRFADRVQRHFFNGGALTPSANLARWNALTQSIDRAIVAESARWGDYQPNGVNPGQPHTRENAWLPHLADLSANYWPGHGAVALQRFRTANLFPAVQAPEFSRFGGPFAAGFSLTLSDPNAADGTVWFTTDGSDPRLTGGAVRPTAVAYTTAVALTAETTVRARVLQGGVWSALTEARFAPAPDQDGDGLPDDWEVAHGTQPGVPDASADPDGDGHSNHQEFLAGTHPQLVGEVLRLAEVEHLGAALRVRFPTHPDRLYTLETAPTPAGPWTANQTVPGTGAVLTVEIVVPPENSRMVARVRTQVP